MAATQLFDMYLHLSWHGTCGNITVNYTDRSVLSDVECSSMSSAWPRRIDGKEIVLQLVFVVEHDEHTYPARRA